jgi:hypothetical protein
MVTLPPITQVIHRNTDSITVGYTVNGTGNAFGAAIILTSRGAFGPIADLPRGVAIAEGSNEYLARGSAGQGYKLYNLAALDLDTLIETANVIIEGHELTEAESALCQVDE